MPDVVFTAYSNFNPSRYEFRFGTFRAAIDFGAGFDDEEAQQLAGQPMPDVILITHGHRDHIGMVPQAMQRWRKVPVYATFETVCLGEWIWTDELNVAQREGRPLPFNAEDIDRAVRRIRRFVVGKPVALNDELTVTPFNAGHILGAVGLVFTYQGDNFVVTGDISMHSHGFIKGACLPMLQTCRTLVRESTYAGIRQTRSRDDIKRDFIAATERILGQRGKVIIPALSIDRLPETYAMLHEAKIDARWPLMVAGGSWPANVYADYAPGAQMLRAMPRFENRQHALDVMRAQGPIVVLATSGMMAPGTPSWDWGLEVLRDPASAILMVNWQNPTQFGSLVLNGVPGEDVRIGSVSFKKRCHVERFDFSSHAKENEMGELEDSLNPDFIVHVHGEPGRIASFIEETRDGDGPLRVQPQPWQEIVL